MLLGVFLQLLTPAALFAATIKTCVVAKSQTTLNDASLKKMIETELARYPSHQAVSTDCSTTLHVETFPFSERNYVTLRMSGEVPVRYAYASTNELVQNIQKGMRLVLENDPVYLKENISQYSDTQRALHSLTIKGTTRFGMELFESITRTGKGATFGPGLAVGLYRGSSNLHVFARIHGSLALPDKSEERLYRPVGVGLDAGFNLELNDTRPVAGYIGGGIGVGFMRFEGEVSGNQQTANELLVQAFARLGVRFFRLTAFDMDVFAAAYLPFHPVSDIDTTLLGDKGRAYTPQLQMGLGIGF